MQLNEEIKLEDLGNGDFLNSANTEFERVVENMRNEKYDAKKMRSITIKITCKPDSERETAEFNTSFSVDLAGPTSKTKPAEK